MRNLRSRSYVSVSTPARVRGTSRKAGGQGQATIDRVHIQREHGRFHGFTSSKPEAVQQARSMWDRATQAAREWATDPVRAEAVAAYLR